MSQMLVKTRDRVYRFVKAYARKNGYPPSMREIGDAVGLSSLSSVSHQLAKLEAEGKIERKPNAARTIRIVDDYTPQ